MTARDEVAEFPQIGVFKRSDPIILEMAENGGWIVRQSQGQAYEPHVLGAYSNAADMIDALAVALFVSEKGAAQ